MKGPRIFASRLASFIVICLTLAALTGGALAGAQAPSPDPSAHLLVVPETPAAQAALGRSDARVVAGYESFALVEAAGADEERLRDAGADRRDDMRSVRTAAGEIDPTSERRSLAAKEAPDRDETLALVQFIGPPKDAWLERLRATGARVVTYQAENGYVVHASGAAVDRLAALVGTDPAVRAVGVLTAADKVEGRGSGSGDYALSTVAGAAGEQARDEAARSGPSVGAAATVGALRTQYLSLSAGEVADLARDPAVVAIEPSAEPELLDERAAQIVAGNLTTEFAPTGPGYRDWLVDPERVPDEDPFDFTIDVTDEGLDDGADPPAHPDFFEQGSPAASDRVSYLSNYTTDPDTRDCGGHGTNVASIAAGYNEGTGSSNEDLPGFNYGIGVAPFARVGMSKIFACDGSFGSPSFSALTASAYANGARISNNSWGTGGFDSWGLYTARAREYDQLVRDAQPANGGDQQMVEVFAAGNDGEGNPEFEDEGYGTIHAEGSAKNVITVGAAESVHATETDGCGTPDSGADNASDVVDFSSRGPTDDGRLKPDLVAPGTHVTGARPQHVEYDGDGTCNSVFQGTLYSLISGSSQAAAHVSGAAALVRDWYTRTQGVPPSPALTKALLINAATDLAGGENGKGDTIAGGPNADQGWGRVNVGAVFDSTASEFRDQLPADILDESGQSRVRTYAVEDPDKPVKVTLVWTDAPGPPGGDAFVNNLDLEVAAGGHTYKGNVFGGAFSRTGGAADTRNNVESVYLPAGTPGRLAVTVRGAAIAGDGVPSNPGPFDPTDQDFALVVSNADEQAAPVLVHESTTIAGGDGDAVLEPHEHVDLSAEVRNAGDVEATSLDATLTGGEGLDVDEGSAAYPDLAPGDAGSNDTPFEVGTADGASCGADVSATLAITTSSPAGETHAIPLTVPTGEVGPSHADELGPASLAIPDDNAEGVTSDLFVPERGRIKDVDVKLGSVGDPGIDHPWVGDLVVDLIGPDGTTVRLADHPGGPDNDGDDFAGTTFDDEAGPNIAQGSPPYDGSFRPQNDQLSRFDGKDRFGTWRLRVRDLFEGEVGHLRRWGVTSRKASCDVDHTPPETAIDFRGTAVDSNSARFEFHSPNDPDATFECQLDSNPYEPCSSPKAYGGLPDGAHTFRVRAIDGSDNEDPTPDTHVWTVHTTPPDTAIASGPTGFVASREASFQFSSDQDAEFECSLDGGQFTNCSTGRAYSGLADGSHSFQVRARNMGGKLDPTPASRGWTVDTVAPALAVTDPTPVATTRDRTPTVRGLAGTAPGDASTVQVQVYAGPSLGGRLLESHTVPRDASGVWSATAGSSASLGPGLYTARAVQLDAAGNVGTSAPVTFTVALPPAAPGFVVAPAEDRLADALAGRLTALAACASACKVSAKLTVSSRAARRLGMPARRRPVSLGSGARRRPSEGSVAVRLRLRGAARAALRRRAVAKATLRVTISEDGRKLTLERGVALRRRAGLRRIAARGLRLWAVSAERSRLTGRLKLSARQARRLGLKPRKGSKRVELASGRTTVGRKPTRLTLRVRRDARRAVARSRRVGAVLEAASGASPEGRRTASLRMTLHR